MSFTVDNEKQNRMSFLDVHIIFENKTFSTSAHSNLPLVEFLHILTALYCLCIYLVLFILKLIGTLKYVQVGRNYELNYIF